MSYACVDCISYLIVYNKKYVLLLNRRGDKGEKETLEQKLTPNVMQKKENAMKKSEKLKKKIIIIKKE